MSVCLSVVNWSFRLYTTSRMFKNVPEWSRMFQNACGMFQNACRMCQNACRMFQNDCRIFQNVPEFSRMFQNSCRMFQKAYRMFQKAYRMFQKAYHNNFRSAGCLPCCATSDLATPNQALSENTLINRLNNLIKHHIIIDTLSKQQYHSYSFP